MANFNNTTAETELVADCAKMWLEVADYDNFFRVNGTSSPAVGRLIFGCYITVMTWGICGNVMTVSAVIRKPQMRINRNLFITNLALSDFFMCTVTTPLTMYTVMYQFWPYGELACKMASACFGFTVFLSTLSISAIGLDRFLAIISPTRISQNHHVAFGLFVCVWVFAMILSAPIFYTAGLVPVFANEDCGIKLQVCFEVDAKWKKMWLGKRLYTTLTLMFQYCLPLCVLIFVYAKISGRIRRRMVMREQMQVAQPMCSSRRRMAMIRQRRTMLLLMAIVLVFACSWLPFNIFTHLFMYNLVDFSVPWFAFTHLIAMTSACSNPVLYGVLNENFRKEFVDILECLHIMPLLRRMCGRCTCLNDEMEQNAKDGDYEDATTQIQTRGGTLRWPNRLPPTAAEDTMLLTHTTALTMTTTNGRSHMHTIDERQSLPPMLVVKHQQEHNKNTGEREQQAGHTISTKTCSNNTPMYRSTTTDETKQMSDKRDCNGHCVTRADVETDKQLNGSIPQKIKFSPTHDFEHETLEKFLQDKLHVIINGTNVDVILNDQSDAQL